MLFSAPAIPTITTEQEFAWLPSKITPNQTNLQEEGRKRPISQSGSSESADKERGDYRDENMQAKIGAEKLNWPPSVLPPDIPLSLNT